jgi:membrane-associated protein
MVGCAVTAIFGDQVGYLIGRRVGPSLFKREDSRLFKRKYVEDAEAFFEKHGSKTIVMARFVPIVRTFVPVIAGVSNMEYRTFVTFNVVGGILWSCGVILLGYFLGQVDVVAEHLELAILSVVAISLLPMVIEVLRSRRKAAAR